MDGNIWDKFDREIDTEGLAKDVEEAAANGGGRLRVNAKDIPLDVDALFTVYDEANANAAAGKKAAPAPTTTKTGRSSRRKAETPRHKRR